MATESKLCDPDSASGNGCLVHGAPPQWRKFSAFIAYTVVHLGRATVPLSFHSHPQLGYFSYWLGETVDAVLAFLVIHEILGNVFEPYPALRRFGGVLLQWSVAMLALVSAAAATGTAGEGASRLLDTLLVVDWCVALLKTALILLLFHFARVVGLSWHHYLLGIGIGFAIYTTLDLAAIVRQLHSNLLRTAVHGLIQSLYNCSALVWIVYLLDRCSPAQANLPAAHEVAEWNAALEALLKRD